jgi:hypothetical protein
MPTLQVAVNGNGVTGVALDKLTQQLAADLNSVSRIAAKPAAGTADAGTKSQFAQDIGILVVSGVFSAATVKAIRDVIVAYVERTKARSVILRRGDSELEITAVSAQELAAVTERLNELFGPAELD